MGGPDLLPAWLTWCWLAALSAVLVFHCAHFLRMDGQQRWLHGSHVLMLASMLYMYAGMEFRWQWLPGALQAAVFACSTAGILGWMAWRLMHGEAPSRAWLAALIMQAAMAYMWLPVWSAPVIWMLVAYYVAEAGAWLLGLLDERPGACAAGGGLAAALIAPAHRGWPTRISMAVMAASMAYMFAAMQLMQ